ncbi:MAG: hypothetical protein ACRD2T_10895 [Thermoanaerobaculia bacterium]
MELHRVGVKYFAADPGAVDLEAVVPVFHGWIRERPVEGLLIDVADYRHVRGGPGVVLVGHEADYSLDLSRGRPGFLCVRKRFSVGGAADPLIAAFRGALHGCRALEAAFGGRLRFHTGEAEVLFLDRLHAPNRPETIDGLRGGIEAALGRLYPGLPAAIEPRAADRREPLAVGISVPGAPDLATLCARIG